MLVISSKRKQYKNVVGMELTHGNHVANVGIEDKGIIIENCDGLITNDPEIYLKVSAADCLPIALFDPITNRRGDSSKRIYYYLRIP
jgi:copper oxidase (laccase) domain-containing protein